MIIQPYDSEIGRTFRSIVKGNNLITSDIYGYVEQYNMIIEISTGSKFLGYDMWGITIIKNNIKDDKLSCCVHSLEQVEEYINNLPKEDHSSLINLLNELQ